ncbi:MAG: rod shape-determining protein MreC [Clostridia bacterium]|nr:rod shape-determining protein MreC [Clostridia bacterium]
MKKKKLIVVIITLILIVSISLTVKPVENPNFFQKIIQAIFVPIQNVVMKPINAVTDSINYFAEMKNYKIKNEELTEENAKLSEKIRQLEAYEAENVELRELLNLSKKYVDRENVVASIISKEPGLWFNVFVVDKGKKDGVKVDSVVLTHNGLVGKVVEVYENSSKIVSILDASNQIGAKITKTGELVTASGDMNLTDKGLIKINYITSDIPLSEGDVIETSGIAGVDGIYPEGIYIGTVKEIENDDMSLLSRYATVTPGVNFKTLREVIILK